MFVLNSEVRLHCWKCEKKKVILKMDGDTFRGGNSTGNNFVFYVNRGFLWKGLICSASCRFFPIGDIPLDERFDVQESKQEALEVVFLMKNSINSNESGDVYGVNDISPLCCKLNLDNSIVSNCNLN